MHYKSLDLAILLKLPKEKVISNHIALSDKLFKNLATLIKANIEAKFQMNSANLIIGNQFIYGLNIDDNFVTSKLQNTKASSSIILLNLNSYEPEEVATSTDKNEFQYTSFILPVIVQCKNENITKLETDKIISAHPIVRELITQFFKDLSIDVVCFGFGVNELLEDTLLNDFESVFNLSSLINESQTEIFKPYDIAFIESQGIVIVPFMSLIAFQNIWEGDEEGLITQYLSFTKNFRTGLNILRLLDREFKIIKTNSAFFTNNKIDKQSLSFMANSLKASNNNFIEENIVGTNVNIKDIKDIDKVDMTSYEESQNGVIATIITWSAQNRAVLKKIVYPTSFDTDKFLNALTEEVKSILPESKILKIKKKDIYQAINTENTIANQ